MANTSVSSMTEAEAEAEDKLKLLDNSKRVNDAWNRIGVASMTILTDAIVIKEELFKIKYFTDDYTY
jgi:hypothetical protein